MIVASQPLGRCGAQGCGNRIPYGHPIAVCDDCDCSYTAAERRAQQEARSKKVVCSRCGASEGEPCKTRGGRTIKFKENYHKERNAS